MPTIYSLEDDTSGLPRTTRSGIPYEIAYDVREKWTPGENWTTAICRVNFDQSFQWVDDMVGRAYQQGVTLYRDLPEQNPQVSNQWCIGVEQIDQGGPANGDEPPADAVDGWPDLMWARYRATFASLPYNLIPDSEIAAALGAELARYTVRRQHAYSREVTYSGARFNIVGVMPLQPVMQTAFKVICFSDLEYTTYRLPVGLIPYNSMDAFLGTVNSKPFDTSTPSGGINQGYDLANGTVLFLGFDDSSKYWDAAGNYVVDLKVHFKWNQNGWNSFLSNSGSFVAVSLDGTANGTKPYASNDLNGIWDF